MHIARLLSIALAGLAAVAGGCASPRPYLPSVEKLPFVYSIDVQQGNVVTQEMLAQLQPGMEKSKVRFIMGTPLIIDTFHTNRWDYLYSMQEGGRGAREQRRITLFFEDDKLARVEGDVTAATGRLVVDQRERSSMVDVPGQYQPSLVDKLKGTVGLAEDAPKKVEKKVEGDDDRSLMDKLKGSVGLGKDGKEARDTAAEVEDVGAPAGSEEVESAAVPPDTGDADPTVADEPADAEPYEVYNREPADDGVTDIEPGANVAQPLEPALEDAPAGEAAAETPAVQVVDIPADAPRTQKPGFFGRLFGGFGGDGQASAQRQRAGADSDADEPHDETPVDVPDSSGDYRDPTEPSTGGF